jgi:hypothetical protein
MTECNESSPSSHAIAPSSAMLRPDVQKPSIVCRKPKYALAVAPLPALLSEDLVDTQYSAARSGAHSHLKPSAQHHDVVKILAHPEDAHQYSDTTHKLPIAPSSLLQAPTTLRTGACDVHRAHGMHCTHHRAAIAKSSCQMRLLPIRTMAPATTSHEEHNLASRCSNEYAWAGAAISAATRTRPCSTY